ncbi:MAG: UDP-N-acetylenolpyruvoylglucosamine reductase [Alphaproteobacteria bacterium]|nr:MAG: UDP-N-acetylenolpyruvoylglucosamine reductase [Alphaproteobacteria bacterium]
MTDSLLNRLPDVRGRISENASISATTWFRVGGPAEVLFKPKDREDLTLFLKQCPSDIPLTVLGVCSNMIIRDGGIKGVVIKMGRGFTDITHDAETNIVTAGASALDMNVAEYCARSGLGGIEFLSGIPGTIGGAFRMNAGAYGAEVVDVLVDCEVMHRDGSIHTYTPDQMGLSYRHNSLPTDVIFLSGRFKTVSEDGKIVRSRIDEIRTQRHGSQPVKARTGGSTFANPEGHKAWELVDAVGGRGLIIGGASMSEKHCNFMLNNGGATAQDLEDLGEELRARVKGKFDVDLRWEIKRIGVPLS